MPLDVLMPQLGESVVEGTLTKWLKAVGDRVEEYEALVEINTDKVDTEIPSPANGVLIEILVSPGTTVQAGAVLARLQTESENGSTPAVPESKPGAPATAAESRSASPSFAQPEPQVGQHPRLGFISPIVARIASEQGVDLSQVAGSGQNGRITKDDLLHYIELRKTTSGDNQTARAPVPHTQPAPQAVVAAQAQTLTEAAQTKSFGQPEGGQSGSQDQVLPLTAVRRAIAEHMVFSERTSPHVTTVMEADLSKVTAHRQTNKASFAQNGANLTFTAYFVAACVQALKAYPIVNSSWSEQGIVIHRAIHIGMAASLGEEGLIVPIIKQADGLSLLGLARTINDLSSRARAHKLQPDEVRGGTFTITNHGTTGSLFATPIINQPQCAILGVGAIQKRVVVVQDGPNDAIAIRPMVYLSLTFDHRILDGAIADNFLAKVVESLQNL